MDCYHCGEKVTLAGLIKFWLNCNMPDFVYRKLQARKEQSELKQLKSLYWDSNHLTDRERLVCSMRLQGHSFAHIAKDMNVTQERVRQIQAKAVRSFQRRALT